MIRLNKLLINTEKIREQRGFFSSLGYLWSMPVANSVASCKVYGSGVGKGDKTGCLLWGRQSLFSDLGILLEDKEQCERVHSRRGN
jgi:hypothetical protein